MLQLDGKFGFAEPSPGVRRVRPSCRVFVTVLLSSGLTIDAQACKPINSNPSQSLLTLDTGDYMTFAGVPQAFHFVRPKGSNPVPIMIYLHGGGFVGGDLSAHDFEAQRIAYWAGFGVFNINYPLLTTPSNVTQSQNPYPTQIQAVRCAYRFAKDQAAAYNLNTSHVIFMGLSVGGYLASEVGLLPGNAPRFDSSYCTAKSGFTIPSGIVSYYGAYDLTLTDHVKVAMNLPWYFQDSNYSTTSNAMMGSPLHWVHDVPLFMVRGDQDVTIPADQQQEMNAAYQAFPAPDTALTIPGKPHGFSPVPNDVSDPNVASTECAMFGFIVAKGASTPNSGLQLP